MTDEADEAPRDTHLPSPMEAKEFPGQVRFLELCAIDFTIQSMPYEKNFTTGQSRSSNATSFAIKL